MNSFQQRLQRLELDYNVAKELHSKTQADYSDLSNRLTLLNECNEFLATAIRHKVTDTKDRLESLVNQGLAYIFGDSLRIQITSEFKNNKTQFSLQIVKDNTNTGRAEDFGGGVLSVVAFLLKVSAVILTKTERFMVFDESLAFVSAEYQEPLSKFIATLCEQMNFDIVLITHQPKLSAHAHCTYQAEATASGLKYNKYQKESDND